MLDSLLPLPRAERRQASTDRDRIRTHNQQLDEATRQHNGTSHDRRAAQNEANRAAQIDAHLPLLR